MPGIVKKFFERIAGLNFTHPAKIGFIVQSGFPESIHSVFVERYLGRLTKRLKCEYIGNVIKGGVEGMQIMPGWMKTKLFVQFDDLGEYFAVNEVFSSKIQESFRKPYKMSRFRQIVFSMMLKTGLRNYYWDSNLKNHGAFQHRFDRPFQEKPGTSFTSSGQ